MTDEDAAKMVEQAWQPYEALTEDQLSRLVAMQVMGWATRDRVRVGSLGSNAYTTLVTPEGQEWHLSAFRPLQDIGPAWLVGQRMEQLGLAVPWSQLVTIKTANLMQRAPGEGITDMDSYDLLMATPRVRSIAALVVVSQQR